MGLDEILRFVSNDSIALGSLAFTTISLKVYVSSKSSVELADIRPRAAKGKKEGKEERIYRFFKRTVPLICVICMLLSTTFNRLTFIVRANSFGE